MEQVRVGIIGCGGIANGKHMPSLKQLPNVKMVAFCDIIEERAIKARADYGTPDCAVYTDYRELLEDKSIDVVHVCTPNRAHSFITVDALHAGKHVMCEKPMAINSEEAKKMLDAAKETGKKLTIGYQSRQRADSRYLKNECLAGTFGDIYYAKATALRRRAVPTWGVFLNEYEQGGGPLIDIGTHALDLTLWMMDNYQPKYCLGQTFHKLNKDTNQGNDWGNWDPEKFTVEDSAFGMVVMENGAVINLESSWALNTLETREAVTSVCGTLAGADMIDGLRINGIRQNYKYEFKPTFTGGGAAYFEGVSSADPSVLEAAQWIDAVINDKTPCVTPEQAFTVTRILEGIYMSAKNGDIFRF
ncbi:oxidoreductase family NAD-binding Rossmann fold protein [Clostridium sp. CAG:448]|nr:oxidoreductase family NAD-binding Rossmann fold protein [Clostridium sp. CAG:448]